jgi:hypothetical protein
MSDLTAHGRRPGGGEVVPALTGYLARSSAPVRVGLSHGHHQYGHSHLSQGDRVAPPLNPYWQSPCLQPEQGPGQNQSSGKRAWSAGYHVSHIQ